MARRIKTMTHVVIIKAKNTTAVSSMTTISFPRRCVAHAEVELASARMWTMARRINTMIPVTIMKHKVLSRAGAFDDDDFISNEICCVCGGGTFIPNQYEDDQESGSLPSVLFTTLTKNVRRIKWQPSKRW